MQASVRWPLGASADSDRSEVVMFSSGAAWLDGATYGSPSRVAERLGLETTSTNAASHNSAPQQGTLNERPQDWLNPKKPYHPVITSSPSQASTDSDVEASDGAVPHASWIPFGDNLHLPDDPDGGDGIRNYYVQKALKDDLRNDQNDHDVIRRGLENQLAAGDAITIGTIRTVDTVPLGTDLDPHNAYNNAWAARRITDAPGKALLTHDLGRRVLDAENLGFTYGQQVHGERKFYHQGVKNAVAYFLQEGLQVIVVGKRSAMHKSLAREVESGRCHILIADDSDDVFVMKQAFEQRCPMVSRDNFRVHQTDLRIKQDVRRWICGAGGYLQVKFMFDRNGAFNVDYDHQMPILCPSHH